MYMTDSAWLSLNSQSDLSMSRRNLRSKCLLTAFSCTSASGIAIRPLRIADISVSMANWGYFLASRVWTSATAKSCAFSEVITSYNGGRQETTTRHRYRDTYLSVHFRSLLLLSGGLCTDPLSMEIHCTVPGRRPRHHGRAHHNLFWCACLCSSPLCTLGPLGTGTAHLCSASSSASSSILHSSWHHHAECYQAVQLALRPLDLSGHGLSVPLASERHSTAHPLPSSYALFHDVLGHYNATL